MSQGERRSLHLQSREHIVMISIFTSPLDVGNDKELRILSVQAVKYDTRVVEHTPHRPQRSIRKRKSSPSACDLLVTNMGERTYQGRWKPVGVGRNELSSGKGI